MTTNLAKLNMSFPIGSLDAYILHVNQIPMLTAEEEYNLAQRLQHENDLEAAKRLVMAHLRFVVKIARGYAGYGLPQADLIQEGNIGLMKAVKRFDSKVGVRLVSFAVHWIRAEMHEYIVRNWRIVKIATTKAQRKLFFNLRKAAKRLGWFTQEEITSVAKYLNVSEADVRLMEARLNNHDLQLEYHPNDEDESAAPIHYLEDHSADPSVMHEIQDINQNREQKLHDALQLLDARSKDILQSRWLSEKKITLHDLAAKYNISAERVRQLEKIAMEKIKTAF